MHCLIGRICTSVGVDNLRLVIFVMTWRYYCGGRQKQIVVALQYSYLNACELHIPTEINLPGCSSWREQRESSEFPYESAHICFPFVFILFGLTTSNERQQFYNNRHPSLQGQPSEVSCRSIFPIRFIGVTTQCAVEFTPYRSSLCSFSIGIQPLREFLYLHIHVCPIYWHSTDGTLQGTVINIKQGNWVIIILVPTKLFNWQS